VVRVSPERQSRKLESHAVPARDAR
jgi:hypothetical protein